jgi:hypothetical protein
LRVKTRRIGPGGGGAKTGFPLHGGGFAIRRYCEGGRSGGGGRIQRKGAKAQRGKPQPKRWNRIEKWSLNIWHLSLGNTVREILPKMRSFLDLHYSAASRNQSENGGWRMEETGEASGECWSGESAMNCSRQKAQNAGLDHREPREIREKRAAFVRVFRVVRGENAVFLSLFEPFCGKSMQVAVQEPFTPGAEFFQLKCSQTQSNPVKPFFYFDRGRRQRIR